MPETKKTFCRFCHVFCGLEVDVENNRVIAVRGDQDNPVSEGYTCPKGRAEVERINHPDRLRVSQKRVDGEFRDIDSAQAVDEIGAKLQQIVEWWHLGLIDAELLGNDALELALDVIRHHRGGNTANLFPLRAFACGAASRMWQDVQPGCATRRKSAHRASRLAHDAERRLVAAEGVAGDGAEAAERNQGTSA